MVHKLLEAYDLLKKMRYLCSLDIDFMKNELQGKDKAHTHDPDPLSSSG